MRYRTLSVSAFLVLVCLPVRAQECQIVHEVYGAYQRITVIDTPNGYRQLIFDARLDGSDAIQSEMDLSNPDEPTLPYSRHKMAALLLAAKLGRIRPASTCPSSSTGAGVSRGRRAIPSPFSSTGLQTPDWSVDRRISDRREA